MSAPVAVVTGAASGIGAATVRKVVAEGGAVVIADVQDAPGAALAAELGDAARFVHVDVTVEHEVAAAVDRAVADFGRLDCMFNNAGIVGAVGPIDELPLEEYDFTHAVLLRSVVIGMKHAARVMKPAGGGVILSTSSIAGVMGGLGPHAYATAKGGIIALTRNVAAELGPHGIRVNAIVPGRHATPMMADAVTGDVGNVEEIARRLADESPLGDRPGTAEDIAEAAWWLMGPGAGFVSGHALVVDGGWTTGGLARAANPGPRRPAHRPLIREAGGRGLG
ncbi:MAG: SDR family oxidoreductase [Acidimicrobiia bacterium]